MTAGRCTGIAAFAIAAVGWAAPLHAQFAAAGDTARVQFMLELYRRAEVDQSLRRTFVDDLLRGEVILPSFQYYYSAKVWLLRDSLDAQQRRDVDHLRRIAAMSRLLDAKLGAASARPGLLASADSARRVGAANLSDLDARQYATSVTLWQVLLPDSLFSPAILQQRLDAVGLRKQEGSVRALAAQDRRAATTQRTGQAATHAGEAGNRIPNGHGVQTTAAGDRYEGEFRNGTPNGHGILDGANGTRFEGEFANGAATGTLTIDLPSGARYVGPMKNGHRNGEGSLDLSSGERYVGGFRDDAFDGRGMLEYANGGRYDGEWRQGKRQGSGTEEYAGGWMLRGRFENDRFVQPETIEPIAALPPEVVVADPPPQPVVAVERAPQQPAPAPTMGGLRTVTIVGRVLDSVSRKPLRGVTIYLNGSLNEQGSKEDGTFSVTHEAPVQLIVRRRGYVPFALLVDPDNTNVGDLQLHSVRTDDDRRALEAMDIRLYPRLGVFYERRAKYRRGAFWTPDELDGAAGQIPDLLRQQPGFKNICLVNHRGAWDCGKSDRGPSTIMGSGQSPLANQQQCTVRVWTDDVGPERTLDDIRMTDLLAIEAYPTPIETPEAFGTSRCATVRLWTKRAAAR